MKKFLIMWGDISNSLLRVSMKKLMNFELDNNEDKDITSN